MGAESVTPPGLGGVSLQDGVADGGENIFNISEEINKLVLRTIS
jgi:hypothetical protein